MFDRLPSYRHHKPSGQAVVTLNGRDRYLGKFDSPESWLEFDRLIAEWLAHGRQLPDAVPCGGLSVAELLAAYLRFAEHYYSSDGKPTSEYTAMKDAVRPVRELYARFTVREFGPIALKAARQQMIDQGLCRRHINQRVNRIRRVFKWGVENEIVPPEVLHGLQAVAPLKRGRTIARESDPVQHVPDEHVLPVLTLVSRQVAAMIQLQLLTGMRPGEVVLLRPCDVDQSGSIWIYRPHRHKTDYRGLDREVLLGPKAQEILRPWLDRDVVSYCFSPTEAEEERNLRRRQHRKTPMTPSQAARTRRTDPRRAKRDRYDRDSYRRAIEYAIKKAGTPHWHPHQLRHSCATKVRQEHGLDVAQLILGHQSADITQVYAKVNRQKASAAVSQFG